METTNTGTAAAATDSDAALAVVMSIASATIPTAPEKIRDLHQKERTAKIRSMLRGMGIKVGAVGKGVSVVSATGSMCYWTNVRFKGLRHAAGTSCGYTRMECHTCRANLAAVRTVEKLILTAFPDLDDRSDSQTDHFNFVFTVNAS